MLLVSTQQPRSLTISVILRFSGIVGPQQGDLNKKTMNVNAFQALAVTELFFVAVDSSTSLCQYRCVVGLAPEKNGSACHMLLPIYMCIVQLPPLLHASEVFYIMLNHHDAGR